MGRPADRGRAATLASLSIEQGRVLNVAAGAACSSAASAQARARTGASPCPPKAGPHATHRTRLIAIAQSLYDALPLHGFDNAAGSYETKQSYGYDALYQITSAQGTSTDKPYGVNDYVSTYNQSFAYDSLGNLTQKTSSCSTNPSKSLGDDLNYGQSYSYYAGKAHQAEIIGNLYYRYDANGNMIEERQGGHGTGTVLAGTVQKEGNLRMTDTGFGLVLSGTTTAPSVYCRQYVWDELIEPYTVRELLLEMDPLTKITYEGKYGSLPTEVTKSQREIVALLNFLFCCYPHRMEKIAEIRFD